MTYQNNSAPTIELVDSMLYSGEEPRPAHAGIFAGCVGELPENFSYLGEAITVRDIEEKLIQQYRFRDMSFTTWQEFQNAIVNTWNRNFPVFAQNIENVEEFTVIDDKETTTENIQDQTHAQATDSSTGKYSDTPNQFANDGTNNGLTSINMGEGKVENQSKAARDRVVTVDKGGNAFERWLELSAINRNLVYDFIDKFRWCFLETYVISKRSNYPW